MKSRTAFDSAPSYPTSLCPTNHSSKKYLCKERHFRAQIAVCGTLSYEPSHRKLYLSVSWHISHGVNDVHNRLATGCVRVALPRSSPRLSIVWPLFQSPFISKTLLNTYIHLYLTIGQTTQTYTERSYIIFQDYSKWKNIFPPSSFSDRPTQHLTPVASEGEAKVNIQGSASKCVNKFECPSGGGL